MLINYEPFLIIISSPSGAGKSTLCGMLTHNDEKIKLSISATTRPKREKEIDGIHYHFLSDEEFSGVKRQDGFLESANVFDYKYGTPKKMVEEELLKGNLVLFDIDWQGARQIKGRFPKELVLSIFILPPSLKELERRLRARAQDPEEVVQKRMKKSLDEISHFDEYDYILVNDNLNDSYQKLQAIIDAKRLSCFDRNSLKSFIAADLS